MILYAKHVDRYINYKYIWREAISLMATKFLTEIIALQNQQINSSKIKQNYARVREAKPFFILPSLANCKMLIKSNIEDRAR
jgi:hypothetical protein